MVAMQKGIARGIFSNEAGLGSAPIAAATVKTDEPVAQGLVSMTGTIIDTLIYDPNEIEKQTVTATIVDNKATFDFSQMIIDCGTF